MKKSYNPVSDVRNESVEGTRRLYRAISDLARNLDECRDRAQTCAELFSPSAEAQRVRLREYCERLIFADPCGYGRKGEEMLWRKGYYDIVTSAKRVRKNNTWNEEESMYLQCHLYAGVGHYHHLILRLQIEFKLDVKGYIDFPLLVSDGGLPKGKTSSRANPDVAGREWAQQALHRSLVFLGDLSRYLLEILPVWDTGLAQRYYLQAINLNSDIGMPHNQLGTLAGGQNYSVDAAYHYMRCLTCLQTFEGAEGNLRRIFERNSKCLEANSHWDLIEKVDGLVPTERIQRFISRFMILLDVWFFEKVFPGNFSQFCQQMIEELRHCLLYAKRFPSDSQLSIEKLDLEELLSLDASTDLQKPEYLKDDTVFKLVCMLLLCIMKLQTKRSKLNSGLIAFTVAVLSEVLQQIIEHFEDSVLTISSADTAPPYITPSTSGENSNPSLSNESNETATLLSFPSIELTEANPATSSGSDKTSSPRVNGVVSSNENGNIENGDSKNKNKIKLKYLNKFRRRRPKNQGQNSSEESDFSDGDLPYECSSSSDEGNEGSENEHINLSYDEDDIDDSDDSSTSTQVESKNTTSQSRQTSSKKKVVNGNCSPSSLSPSDIISKITNDDFIETGRLNSKSKKIVGSENNVVNGNRLESNENKNQTEKIEETANKTNGRKTASPMDPADIIELVAGEGLLQVVKICVDWLRGEEEVLKACSRSSPTLLSRFISILNFINIDAQVLEKRHDISKFFKLKNIAEVFEKVPLPEDVKLKGLSVFKNAHELIDWSYCRNYCLHSKEEALLRIYKLVDFGKFLANLCETNIAYDESQQMFVSGVSCTSPIPGKEEKAVNGVDASTSEKSSASDSSTDKEPTTPAVSTSGPISIQTTTTKTVTTDSKATVTAATGTTNPNASVSVKSAAASTPPTVVTLLANPAAPSTTGRRDEMMQHMGQLWLRAQVHELETRVQRRRGGANLSPYLAVDCDALTAHLPLVKQLVAARRFIVLIPAIVVSALDELKREVSRAREAIRWLEAQFQRGNRFLRAQRQHERMPLPLIKYPKKKDREAWFFFQVVECCYYFSQQNRVHELTPDTSLVTLLVGQAPGEDTSRTYSPLGVARSAGVNLEYIESFHAKWKTSSKSHG